MANATFYIFHRTGESVYTKTIVRQHRGNPSKAGP